MLRLLALTVRPVTGPDTRYRIEQYRAPFRDAGIEVTRHALFSPEYYRSLGMPGRRGAKAVGLGVAFLRRLVDIARHARDYDAVWVSRELFPLGPPLLEQLLFALQAKVILDIDDAIFLPDPTNTGLIHRKLRDFGKLGRLAGKFRAVVCGNAFLADYFRDKNPHVHVQPTVVPMAAYGAIARTASPRPRIGWIGTPTNTDYLELVRGPLAELAARHDFSFRVVGTTRPLGWNLPHLTQIPWTLQDELRYFSDFDIGIMPLRDFPFARGKCAFKLIQFMAAGIPVVASPVGSNLDVVEDGDNGFFAEGPDDWVRALARLVVDPALRRHMGARGRQIVRERYSLEGHWKQYAAIIKECL